MTTPDSAGSAAAPHPCSKRTRKGKAAQEQAEAPQEPMGKAAAVKSMPVETVDTSSAGSPGLRARFLTDLTRSTSNGVYIYI